MEDAEKAKALYELIVEYADRNGVLSLGVACTGSVAYQVALMASTAGLLEEAEAQFEAAIEANERMKTPPYLARTQYDYAHMLGYLVGLREQVAEELDLRNEARSIVQFRERFSELGLDGGADVALKGLSGTCSVFEVSW